MKKQLNTTAIVNELKGNSGFFKDVKKAQAIFEAPLPDNDTVPPRHRDTTIASNHDTVIASNHATVIPHDQDKLTKLCKTVRELGKEAATHRFTLLEKQALAQIIFDYRQRGIKTSENEITRIAINYLLLDQQENADNSLLARILKDLHT